jgi:hypothetical protein
MATNVSKPGSMAMATRIRKQHAWPRVGRAGRRLTRSANGWRLALAGVVVASDPYGWRRRCKTVWVREAPKGRSRDFAGQLPLRSAFQFDRLGKPAQPEDLNQFIRLPADPLDLGANQPRSSNDLAFLRTSTIKAQWGRRYHAMPQRRPKLSKRAQRRHVMLFGNVATL